jgi:hypothetical protein
VRPAYRCCSIAGLFVVNHGCHCVVFCFCLVFTTSY